MAIVILVIIIITAIIMMIILITTRMKVIWKNSEGNDTNIIYCHDNNCNINNGRKMITIMILTVAVLTATTIMTITI